MQSLTSIIFSSKNGILLTPLSNALIARGIKPLGINFILDSLTLTTTPHSSAIGSLYDRLVKPPRNQKFRPSQGIVTKLVKV